MAEETEVQETTTETPEATEVKENAEVKETPEVTEEKSSTEETLLGEVKEVKQEAPETYDFKAPEGVEYDAALLEKANPIFKELNLTNDQAQKLVDIYAGQVESQANEWNKTTEGWKADTLKDLGSDAVEKMATASKFIDKFGGDKVREVLNDTGLGNHPEIVKLFVNAGKAISNDSFVDGQNKNQPVGEEAIALRMFPTMAK